MAQTEDWTPEPFTQFPDSRCRDEIRATKKRQVEFNVPWPALYMRRLRQWLAEGSNKYNEVTEVDHGIFIQVKERIRRVKALANNRKSPRFARLSSLKSGADAAIAKLAHSVAAAKETAAAITDFFI